MTHLGLPACGLELGAQLSRAVRVGKALVAIQLAEMALRQNEALDIKS